MVWTCSPKYRWGKSKIAHNQPSLLVSEIKFCMPMRLGQKLCAKASSKQTFCCHLLRSSVMLWEYSIDTLSSRSYRWTLNCLSMTRIHCSHYLPFRPLATFDCPLSSHAERCRRNQTADRHQQYWYLHPNSTSFSSYNLVFSWLCRQTQYRYHFHHQN